MDDELIGRLRDCAESEFHDHIRDICREAGDEIDRLRGEVALLKRELIEIAPRKDKP